MIRSPRNWRQGKLALLAVVGIGLWPTTAQPAVITFRNDTDTPILVRGISIVNRIARQGKLHVLRPGEVSRELILVPVTMRIMVADLKQPTRIVYQETIQVHGTDLFYAIQTEPAVKPKESDTASPKAKGQSAHSPKLKLVLIRPTPPTTPPASRPHP